MAELQLAKLGEYPDGHFVDPRVAGLVRAFGDRLAQIEKDIALRNAERPIPYEYLLPSEITASINA